MLNCVVLCVELCGLVCLTVWSCVLNSVSLCVVPMFCCFYDRKEFHLMFLWFDWLLFFFFELSHYLAL